MEGLNPWKKTKKLEVFMNRVGYTAPTSFSMTAFDDFAARIY